MAARAHKRIAVLGGGLAGLTAAYELASRDPDCEITIYQMGWRLGGKVASSRNPAQGMRIEEHGIHVLFGAYENLFHVVRRVYDELGLRWHDAFRERGEFVLMEAIRRKWIAWPVGLPRTDGDPGDCLAADGTCAKAPPQLTADLLVWLRDRILEHFAGTRLAGPARWFFGRSLGHACRGAAGLCTPAEHATARVRDTRRLLVRLRANLLLLRIVGLVGRAVWGVLGLVFGRALARRHKIRRLWILAELGIAAAAGLTRAALDERDVRDLDEYDLAEWLGDNGVLGARISRTTARSAALRMVYEVVFAYERGDPARPRLAAGTALQALLRLLFDRRGSLAYTMRAGSAETLITPLYRALTRRPNVRVAFFHRIDKLEPSADGEHIERIHFTRQAVPQDGAYDPLLDGGGWPHRPKYERLVDGERLRASEHDGHDLESPTFTPPTATTGVLHRGGPAGGDFDAVVLAMPVAALATVCEPLLTDGSAWRRMVDNVETTATQAVQLWFDRPATELGWRESDPAEPAMLGGYAQPFGNWVDLSLTLTAEAWRESGLPEPASVAYLAGPLPDAQISAAAQASRTAARAAVRERCADWLDTYGPRLWPAAFAGASFDHGRLVAAVGPDGDPWTAQHFQANIRPAERYTLSLPRRTSFRLAPGNSGFANLYLAGDWTTHGFDVGAAESAAMSGRLAARAVLGLDAHAMPVYGERGVGAAPSGGSGDATAPEPAAAAGGGRG